MSELNVEIMSTSNEVIPNEIMSAVNEQFTKKQLKKIEYDLKISENIIKNNLKVTTCFNGFIETFLTAIEVDSTIKDLLAMKWKDEKNQASLTELIQENKLKSKLKNEEEVQHNIDKNAKKEERLKKKKLKTQERIQKIKQKKIEKNMSKCKKNLPPGSAPLVSKYDKNKVPRISPIATNIAPIVPTTLSVEAKPFNFQTNRFKKYVPTETVVKV